MNFVFKNFFLLMNGVVTLLFFCAVHGLPEEIRKPLLLLFILIILSRLELRELKNKLEEERRR